MPRSPKYTEEELIEAIRELNEQVSRTPPRKSDMNKYGDHAAGTYQHRFGSWNEAVAQAGFEPRKKGQDFAIRPDECPLCESENGYLDFHHWRYGENQLGVYLCRDCHDDVHGMKGKTENPDWLVHAIQNLVEKHVDEHPDEIDTAVILKRYNLPDVEELVDASLPENRST